MPQGLLVCDDLIFSSKITGTAKALAVPFRVSAGAASALQSIDEETRLVLVDLSSPASTTAADLAALREKLAPAGKLIAYGSHVDVEKLELARQAGCDAVLPRSQFVERLPDLIRSIA